MSDPTSLVIRGVRYRRVQAADCGPAHLAYALRVIIDSGIRPEVIAGQPPISRSAEKRNALIASVKGKLLDSGHLIPYLAGHLAPEKGLWSPEFAAETVTALSGPLAIEERRVLRAFIDHVLAEYFHGLAPSARES
jgi:hypothetical protein